MTARFRHRIYPNRLQRLMLAKTFGCARVVYNDTIRLRQDLDQQGEQVSDTELQKQVITQAKLTVEREWLSEVASVPLVQSLQDAHLAFRNFFKSLKGERKGRKIGFPKFKKKHSTQSIRFTTKGKSIRYGRDFHVISRWEPTSQRCSSCGQLGGQEPLDVREWVCLHCGAIHDRDIHAAININVINVAGGPSETQNGRGGQRQTGSPAAANEASTRDLVEQLR